MSDHEFAHLLARASAMLGLCVASMFAFVIVTTESTQLELALGVGSVQPAAVAMPLENSPLLAAPAPSVPTCTLTAVPAVVTPGQTVVLTWHSANATSASNGPAMQNAVVDGSLVVQPTGTTIYQKSVYGPGGSSNCQATVTVESSPTPPANVQASAVSGPDMAAAAEALTTFDETFSPPSLGQAAAVVLSAPYTILTDGLSDYLYQSGIH